MEGPLVFAALVVLCIAACARFVIELRSRQHASDRDTERDADHFTAEAKLQLLHELDNAVKSATQLHERSWASQAFQPSPASPTKVTFADDDHAVVQRTALNAETNSRSEDTADATASPFANAERRGLLQHLKVDTYPSPQQLPLPPSKTLSMQSGFDDTERAILVNAKQYERILKRRATRQLIEKYLESRRDKNAKYGLNGRKLPPTSNACLRFPRGPDGRFLKGDALAQHLASIPGYVK